MLAKESWVDVTLISSQKIITKCLSIDLGYTHLILSEKDINNSLIQSNFNLS